MDQPDWEKHLSRKEHLSREEHLSGKEHLCREGHLSERSSSELQPTAAVLSNAHTPAWGLTPLHLLPSDPKHSFC